MSVGLTLLQQVYTYRPFSCVGHVESPENKKLRFYTSKLVLKFFTARFSMVNLLFLYKMAGREKGSYK